MRKGQVLSYDVIGAVVIFLVAVGILGSHWFNYNNDLNTNAIKISQSSLSFVYDQIYAHGYFDEGLFANNCQSINYMLANMLSGYKFRLEVLDANDDVLLYCNSPINRPTLATAERVGYYNDKPIKLRLLLYSN